MNIFFKLEHLGQFLSFEHSDRKQKHYKNFNIEKKNNNDNTGQDYVTMQFHRRFTGIR